MPQWIVTSGSKETECLYTRYPIVARRAWPLGRVRRASKGILHTNQVLIKRIRTHGKHIKKISPKWVDGPFHIVRKISDVNWEITDSKGSHRIYHSNLMMGAGTRKEPVISRTDADTEEVEATYMPRLYEVTIPQLPITSTIQVPDSTRLIFTATSSPRHAEMRPPNVVFCARVD